MGREWPDHRICDKSGCGRRATWWVGLEQPPTLGVRSRGHPACDRDLAEACAVTLKQLLFEGETDARLDVRPIQSVEAINANER